MPRLSRQQTVAWYTKKLTEAVERSQEHYIEARCWLARNDLFYLLVAVLGRKDVNRDWLFERCRQVQAEPDGYLDLWAREHYKSTIITFGLTIQDILNDPEITVGIFSHTRPIAKGFLRQIKRELEENETLRLLFPDILWENCRDAPKWSEDDGLIVRRKSNPKESTVEAWGLVDGQPTSRHFSRLVYDDVVTLESVNTPEMILKTTNAWALSLNLGTADGKRRTIGTRYNLNDSYREMIERQSVVPRIYPATSNGEVDGEPILLKREALAEKRRDMGPFVFACQMLQNPKSDAAQGFQADWLDYWVPTNRQALNVYIVVDPANEKRPTNDYTSAFVVGLGEDEVFRVITMVRDRLNLAERADMLFSLHRQYRPLKVGYEKYGKDSDIQHFEDRMKRENYKFAIQELGGQVKKPDRIKRLVPLFEQGRILLPETCFRANYEGEMQDLTQVFIREEYETFPVGSHDDMLDALARIADPEFKVARPDGRSTRPRPSRANNAYSPSRWRQTA